MHSFCLEGGLSRSALGLRSGRSRPRIRRLLLITPRAPLVEPLEMRSSAVLALAMAAGAHATEMKLAVDSSGAYTVSVGGEAWFTSAATAYTSGHKTLSTADGSLKLQGSTKGTGSDASGKYASTTLTWDSGAFVTEFREYNSMIVFEQRFPQGVQGTNAGAGDPYDLRDDVSSSFPAFVSNTTGEQGFLAFSGDMTGSGAKHGRGLDVPHGVTGFGPTCFFSEDLKSSVVLSSFSQFMAASNSVGMGAAKYGLQGSIMSVPAGYSLSFVLAASSDGGVNKAFEQWGDKLLHRYGKSREMTYRDFSLNYLGYSTDNGAYYYYQTEGHTPGKRISQQQDGGKWSGPGQDYQQTLIDVKTYADAQAIPYTYVLLDSWWYYQGVGGGVTNWIGRPDIFPQGNAYLRNQTGWPIMGHNRYWAIDNIYATQNGGQYDFVIEKSGEGPGFKNFGWPTEQRFWDDLMYNSSQWGLFMYEQDWLDTEYDNVRHLNFNASAARTWLLQMGTAAARNDLTIQYCMSHCRHIMQSVEIPAVTNARASGDYHPGGDQWRPLGTTGIFAWSVAIAPTKDNYWSTDVQTGSAYGDYATVKESFNRLQAAVSTLSKGPVAPSDKIGRSDAALIMKSCAADGRLLQGDKPAMVIDSSHVRQAFSPDAHSGGQECRITVTPDPCPLHKSNGGYSAFTPMNKKSGGGYVRHDGDYCDCTGKGGCSQWAYHSRTADYDACESKCTKLNCSCFDYEGPVGPAPPAPAVNASGPDGEVWVTHTKLDSHRFGVVLAAELKSDYSFSLVADMGMNSSGKYVSYEANATSAVSTSQTIPLKACGKWDFQLHAVAPTLDNGWTLLGEPSKWVPVSNGAPVHSTLTSKSIQSFQRETETHSVHAAQRDCLPVHCVPAFSSVSV